MVQIFFQSLLIGYSGAIMPGSLLTYTIDKSLKSGSKTGLLISVGHLLLELIIVILLISGTGSFLATEATQMIIGFIGASNPYFLLWWAIVGLGLLLNAYTLYGVIGVALFYFGHILSDISWYSFVSVFISRTRKFINQKIYRIIIAILGVCLVGFGISFIVNSFKFLFKF